MPSATSPSQTLAPEPDLKQSLATARPLLLQVDALILDLIKQEIPLIHDVAVHIIQSGGKRLRPLLTLLCSQLCGYDGTRHIQLAAAVEFIHTATLLHDDVVDDSDRRRGLTTANNVWGNKPSILVGDFLLSQAFRLMVADGSLDVLDILSHAAAVISKGEVLQLTTEKQIGTSMAIYTDVITAKTAELFAAACEIAPVIAGKGELRSIFRQYGMALGIAFQAVDDTLDYVSDAKTLGKDIGDDFKEKKMTLPVIFLREALPTSEQAQLGTFFSAEYIQREGDFECITAWMRQYHIHEKCAEFIDSHCEEALQAWQQMPEHPTKAILKDIVEYGAKRSF